MVFINRQNNMKESKLIVVDNPLSRASEEFRMIRTTLNFSFTNQNNKTISVTSANKRDGKTMIATNLAATFAQERTMVLLVDTDMRNPEVHHVIGVENERGLSDVLTNSQLSITDVIRESQMNNLHYITSGKIQLNPAELLNSSRMAQLIERMKKRYDIVIFDTPPLLSVTDAQIMAAQSEGTILVFPQNGVTGKELKDATTLLNNVHANVLGTIMNRAAEN